MKINETKLNKLTSFYWNNGIEIALLLGFWYHILKFDFNEFMVGHKKQVTQ
ncbi:hypothetical protein ES703_69943 [subsurface metagenome]|jgi:hypothetical protein